jgi:hypothetical protein
VDGIHHVLEDRVEQLTCLLGVAIGKERHRALQVREEDRDLLALAFERGLRVDDPLCEMLGGVGVGCGEL